MFLLKYTALNTEGYMLVYAPTLEVAIEKLKDHYFYLSQLNITSATLE